MAGEGLERGCRRGSGSCIESPMHRLATQGSPAIVSCSNLAVNPAAVDHCSHLLPSTVSPLDPLFCVQICVFVVLFFAFNSELKLHLIAYSHNLTGQFLLFLLRYEVGGTPSVVGVGVAAVVRVPMMRGTVEGWGQNWYLQNIENKEPDKWLVNWWFTVNHQFWCFMLEATFQKNHKKLRILC